MTDPRPAHRTRLFLAAATMLGVAGIVLLSPAAVSAQRARNGREAVADHAERIDNRRDHRDDRRDRTRIRTIARDWNAAVRRGDRAAEANADLRLGAWLREELGESRQEVREADRERRRSRRERGRSRREAQGSGDVDDRRDLRGDRRDLRDDRRDGRQAAADLAATRRLAQELHTLQPRFTAGTATPAEVARKRSLLAELVRLAEREVARERRERREDRGETREDRRKRREDRR